MHFKTSLSLVAIELLLSSQVSALHWSAFGFKFPGFAELCDGGDKGKTMGLSRDGHSMSKACGGVMQLLNLKQCIGFDGTKLVAQDNGAYMDQAQRCVNDGTKLQCMGKDGKTWADFDVNDVVDKGDNGRFTCGSKHQFTSRDFDVAQDQYSTCAGTQGKIIASAYSTYTLALTNGQNGDYCNGFLKDLHHNYGLGITEWNCKAQDGTTYIMFNSPTTYLGSSIEGAIWDGSYTTHLGGVSCSWQKDWSPTPTGPQIAAVIAGTIFDSGAFGVTAH